MEANFQNSIRISLLKNKIAFVEKIHGNEFQRIGISDLIGCTKDGLFIAIECKEINIPVKLNSIAINFTKEFSATQVFYLLDKFNHGGITFGLIKISSRVCLLFPPKILSFFLKNQKVLTKKELAILIYKRLILKVIKIDNLWDFDYLKILGFISNDLS